MAGGEGFEPPGAVKPLTISSRAHSTTLPTPRFIKNGMNTLSPAPYGVFAPYLAGLKTVSLCSYPPISMQLPCPYPGAHADADFTSYQKKLEEYSWFGEAIILLYGAVYARCRWLSLEHFSFHHSQNSRPARKGFAAACCGLFPPCCRPLGSFRVKKDFAFATVGSVAVIFICRASNVKHLCRSRGQTNTSWASVEVLAHCSCSAQPACV